ncbi:MAG: MarC family protein [Oleiphilaceae bacterium]|nr:MarC family protein [Oleiphilaceae bacterium]
MARSKDQNFLLLNKDTSKEAEMSALLEHTISVFMAFFAIMNPIANTAVFASLSEHLSDERRVCSAKRAIMLAFIIVSAFAILGQSLFELFGISITAFRLAGGILIFIIGYHMLNGQSSHLHNNEEASLDDISISPLAVPILAGPGTIATAMNYSMGSWEEALITVFAFFLLSLVTLACFISSSKILKALGEDALNIITRLMGLILCVIGIQMFIDGYLSIHA